MTTPNRVNLGRLKQDAGTYADGELIYLEKHKWDCEWYWGFGYLGNSRCHFHFNSFMTGKDCNKTASKLFDKPKFTDKEWWIIRDLFKQAYALRDAAEVYRCGGNQTTVPGTTDIIRNVETAAILNSDLKTVLDSLWKFVTKGK